MLQSGDNASNGTNPIPNADFSQKIFVPSLQILNGVLKSVVFVGRSVNLRICDLSNTLLNIGAVL